MNSKEPNILTFDEGASATEAPSVFTDYELYHDESEKPEDNSGFWHGILIIPNQTKNLLLELLQHSRRTTNFTAPISLKGIKNDNYKNNPHYRCALAWLNIILYALRSRHKNQNEKIFLGDKKEYIDAPKQLLGCKLIIFRETNGLNEVWGSKYDKFSTTFRPALKGGLHFLGSATTPLHITKIHFDNYEQLKQPIDKETIIGRMNGLRDYISFDQADIVDCRSSNHTKPNAQSYDDCQLIQLTDLLVGTMREYITQDSPTHQNLINTAKQLYKKFSAGKKRMSNSRWENSLCFSECEVGTNGWLFRKLAFKNNQAEAL